MEREVDILDVPGMAVLWLDPDSGEIAGCNGYAASMLGPDEASLRGTRWQDVLGVQDGAATALAQAIESGICATLPPFIMGTAQGGQVVVGGSLVPGMARERPVSVLLLRPLADDSLLSLVSEVTAADTLVILGVDQLAYAIDWGIDETERLLIDIRLALLQIVPQDSVVGLPVAASLLIVLRDLATEEALDVGRAMLSHLRSVLAKEEGGAVAARVCLGLSRRTGKDTESEALMAANNALMHAQSGASSQRICVARENDSSYLTAQAINANGLFSGNRASPERQAFLAALIAVAADPRHSPEYLYRVCALTAEQRDVAAVAVYRRRHDDSYDFVAAGIPGEGSGAAVTEKQLPRAMRQRMETGAMLQQRCIVAAHTAVFPLLFQQRVLGYLVLGYRASRPPGAGFMPGAGSIQLLASTLAMMKDWREINSAPLAEPSRGMLDPETRIEGYVSDNMEGAIDQAVFLARVDMPVAVIGQRGTGKLYVAKVIHQESGGAPDKLVSIECRDFRGRRDALTRIGRELEQAEGKTLVFKSPHLMHADAQVKLARQISSRILADTSPPRYLPAARFVALFPDALDHLMSYGGLTEKLASVFAGYPIQIPPLKDRKRAVIRWAHKILGQESGRRDRKVSGFTPDAERAMRQYAWPGNISEMRLAITAALDKTDHEWLTPVDLGIFQGLSAAGAQPPPGQQPFLASVLADAPQEPPYAPSALEAVEVSLGEALHALLELDSLKPLGAWLDDEVVLAVCERYRGDTRGAAQFLHTKSRNIGRWMPKILSRDHERNSSLLWQTPRRLIRQWISETSPPLESPQQMVQKKLMSHVQRQCADRSVADRARIMGVSTPTFQKRLQEFSDL